MIDYSIVDVPEILHYIFFPHNYRTRCPEGAYDVMIQVDDGVAVACRFYQADPEGPWILFFHGNGEVASDYDDIALHYRERLINIAVADYRGYGASTGTPSLTTMVRDAHHVFRGFRAAIAERGFPGQIWVMGRSLGSTSALEIASHYQDQIRGLIIESGFLNILRILVHLDIPIPDLPLEDIDRQCLEEVGRITIPALFIHGQRDTLVPLGEAELLNEHVGSTDKKLVVIPGATHNDILFTDTDRYMDALEGFIRKTG